MTLSVSTLAADGGTVDAQILRLQLQSATRSGNGVVEVSDMEVTELPVPGTSVRVAGGAAIARGQEAAYQGSYYAFNVGIEDVPVTATGSSAGRTDMIVMRIEDPTIDGTSWNHEVGVDPIAYFRVLEDVTPGQTDVSAGMSAVPLALITIPPATATITNTMITDIRVSSSPRSESVLLMQRGVEPIDLAGNQTTYFENWPDLTWQVRIPEWATQVQLEGDWCNAGFFPDDEQGGGIPDARGALRLAIGFGTGGGPTDLQTPASNYNFNQISPTNGYRVNAAAGGSLAIPASMRGELANVRMQCQGTDGPAGRLRADDSAIFRARVRFNEIPAPSIA